MTFEHLHLVTRSDLNLELFSDFYQSYNHFFLSCLILVVWRRSLWTDNEIQQWWMILRTCQSFRHSHGSLSMPMDQAAKSWTSTQQSSINRSFRHHVECSRRLSRRRPTMRRMDSTVANGLVVIASVQAQVKRAQSSESTLQEVNKVFNFFKFSGFYWAAAASSICHCGARLKKPET